MKVLCLQKARESRSLKSQNLEYQKKIEAMDKLELLDEMMHFQKERSSVGALSIPMMVRGQILFKALELTAETNELRLLARSYHRHLKCELQSVGLQQ